MILVDIGEIGIHTGADCYKLRPSLYAISQLGTPTQIVSLYASVMGAEPPLADVLGVIHACAQDDVSHIFGYSHADDAIPSIGILVPTSDESPVLIQGVAGRASHTDALILARSLLRHGVTGALPPQEVDGEEPEYSAEFDARSYVALAMAHLGATSADAWQMTMTELVGAMRAKFPPVKDPSKRAASKPMTPTEYDATMEYGDAIMAKLAKRKNGAK